MNPLKHFIKIKKPRRDRRGKNAVLPTILNPSPPINIPPIPTLPPQSPKGPI